MLWTISGERHDAKGFSCCNYLDDYDAVTFSNNVATIPPKIQMDTSSQTNFLNNFGKCSIAQQGTTKAQISSTRCMRRPKGIVSTPTKDMSQTAATLRSV
jgi:hypothetical protein